MFKTATHQDPTLTITICHVGNTLMFSNDGQELKDESSCIIGFGWSQLTTPQKRCLITSLDNLELLEDLKDPKTGEPAINLKNLEFNLNIDSTNLNKVLERVKTTMLSMSIKTTIRPGSPGLSSPASPRLSDLGSFSPVSQIYAKVSNLSLSSLQGTSTPPTPSTTPKTLSLNLNGG